MANSCSVSTCNNSSGEKKDLRFHTFPLRNRVMLNLWLRAINRTNWIPMKTSKICSDHFLASDYKNSRQLKPDVVPSVKVPCPMKPQLSSMTPDENSFSVAVTENKEFNGGLSGTRPTFSERIEQRYCIKFCQKLGYTKATTIYKIQQVYGDNAIGVTQIKEWFNRFKDGRTSVISEHRVPNNL